MWSVVVINIKHNYVLWAILPIAFNCGRSCNFSIDHRLPSCTCIEPGSCVFFLYWLNKLIYKINLNIKTSINAIIY